MPALPTTGLTLHCNASDDDHVWVNHQVGSPFHNTVPVDGDSVRAWDNETAADLQFKQLSAIDVPVWRQAAPLMPLPCLDFLRSAQQKYRLYNRSGSAAQPISTIIANNNFVIYIAFLVESATLNNLTISATANHTLYVDSVAVLGLQYRIDAGQLILRAVHEGVILERNISLNTSHVARFRHTGGNIYLSVDGGAEVSTASGNTSNLGGAFDFGAWSSAVGHDGRVGEFASYNINPTAPNLADSDAYFADKWLAAAGGGGVPGVVAGAQPLMSVVCG